MIAQRVLQTLTLSAAALAAFAAHGADGAGTAFVTNQGGGVAVVDLSSWKRTRTIDVGKDPRGIAITPDGTRLVVANQADADVSVVDIASGRTLKHIPIGKNAEFVRVSPDGLHAFVTYEPSSSGKPPARPESPSAKHEEPKDAEDAAPAEIAVIDLKTLDVTARLLASPETEGMEFSPDGKRLVVANEGDDSVVVYDLATRQPVKRIDVTPFGQRPRGVRVSPDGLTWLVTLENSDNVLVLDAGLSPIKAVAAGQGPYGVAYEPGGSRIWVAAARSGELRVLDARTFDLVAAIPVGKRCWHFSFTPDGRKALAACGRSSAVSVIDVAALKPESALEGFQQPWGIVTWPRADGSLDHAAAPH